MVDPHVFVIRYTEEMLREYYNGCEQINEMMDNDDITELEAEDLLLQLDHRYAHRLVDLIGGEA